MSDAAQPTTLYYARRFVAAVQAMNRVNWPGDTGAAGTHPQAAVLPASAECVVIARDLAASVAGLRDTTGASLAAFALVAAIPTAWRINRAGLRLAGGIETDVFVAIGAPDRELTQHSTGDDAAGDTDASATDAAADAAGGGWDCDNGVSIGCALYTAMLVEVSQHPGGKFSHALVVAMLQLSILLKVRQSDEVEIVQEMLSRSLMSSFGGLAGFPPGTVSSLADVANAATMHFQICVELASHWLMHNAVRGVGLLHLAADAVREHGSPYLVSNRVGADMYVFVLVRTLVAIIGVRSCVIGRRATFACPTPAEMIEACLQQFEVRPKFDMVTLYTAAFVTASSLPEDELAAIVAATLQREPSSACVLQLPPVIV